MSTPIRETMSPDELEALREAVRDVCSRHAGPEEARRLLDGTPDSVPDLALWRALSTDLGIAGLLVPERFGGTDAGWAAAQVVLEELGRGLAAAPFLPSAVLAAQLLLATGDDAACADLLPDIAAGSMVATFAIAEPRAGWDAWTGAQAPTTTELRADDGPDGWQLTGRKRAVSFGATADLVLVTAAADGSVALFAVERAAAGVSTSALATLDGTRPMADVTLDATPARLISTPGRVGAAIRRAVELGGLAIAAEDVGAMRACLETSVEYAKLRTQFDRPIGSFQAVKHKLADMLVRVELAEAAVEEAVLAVDDAMSSAPAAAVVAHACAAESFRQVAAETIQTHGGIGFTWEHSAHLYFRRAKTSALAFGGSASYRERLLDRLGLTA